MIEQLFGSKTRVKLLHLFYSNPNRSFYVREITRKIDEQINSVRRELSNMLSIGIISSDTNNNKLYYEVNQDFEFHSPLSEIFGTNVNDSKADNTAPVSKAVSKLKALGHVDLAFYTGQFTRDDSSGVDLLIVGDINQTQLEKYVSELEEQEGKDIRYTVMLPDEFTYRQQVNDRFISLALGSKKQVIIDKHNRLTPESSKITDDEDVVELTNSKPTKKSKEGK
ncbi:hypothetical protein BH23PAT2_BH23PAT2_09000 [soil metagenome]